MTNTIHEALIKAKSILSPVTETAALDAEILLAHTLHKPRSHLYSASHTALTPTEQSMFAMLLERRCQKEPIAYLIQHKEFWSLDLQVTSATLIPRPETELLVELVLKLMGREERRISIADLGTGSGAIGLALAHERPDWHLTGTDISQSALQIARINAQRLGLNNISFYQGNWCTALPSAEFEVIVSNPPYLAETEWADFASGLLFEPRTALVSGLDGLDAIREISRLANSYLLPGSYLLVEHGYLQGERVREIFAKDQYINIYSVSDLAGHERVTVGQKRA